MNKCWLPIAFLTFAFASCATPPAPVAVVKENQNPKYEKLRAGLRYVIYIADSEQKHTEAAIEIENRIKTDLSSKGLVLVDFDQNSLANILRANGQVTEGQAKLVSSAADLIITGRYRAEALKDTNINKGGVFRSRLRLSLAVTESNSAIEKGRFQDECDELASSEESALMHAAIACGDKVSPKLVEKLLYIYGQ